MVNKKKYEITLAGEDIFTIEYEMTDSQYKFLNKLFSDINKSSCGLYIDDLSIREAKK